MEIALLGEGDASQERDWIDIRQAVFQIKTERPLFVHVRYRQPDGDFAYWRDEHPLRYRDEVLKLWSQNYTSLLQNEYRAFYTDHEEVVMFANPMGRRRMVDVVLDARTLKPKSYRFHGSTTALELSKLFQGHMARDLVEMEVTPGFLQDGEDGEDEIKFRIKPLWQEQKHIQAFKRIRNLFERGALLNVYDGDGQAVHWGHLYGKKGSLRMNHDAFGVVDKLEEREFGDALEMIRGSKMLDGPALGKKVSKYGDAERMLREADYRQRFKLWLDYFSEHKEEALKIKQETFEALHSGASQRLAELEMLLDVYGSDNSAFSRELQREREELKEVQQTDRWEDMRFSVTVVNEMALREQRRYYKDQRAYVDAVQRGEHPVFPAIPPSVSRRHAMQEAIRYVRKEYGKVPRRVAVELYRHLIGAHEAYFENLSDAPLVDRFAKEVVVEMEHHLLKHAGHVLSFVDHEGVEKHGLRLGLMVQRRGEPLDFATESTKELRQVVSDYARTSGVRKSHEHLEKLKKLMQKHPSWRFSRSSVDSFLEEEFAHLPAQEEDRGHIQVAKVKQVHAAMDYYEFRQNIGRDKFLLLTDKTELPMLRDVRDDVSAVAKVQAFLQAHFEGDWTDQVALLVIPIQQEFRESALPPELDLERLAASFKHPLYHWGILASLLAEVAEPRDVANFRELKRDYDGYASSMEELVKRTPSYVAQQWSAQTKQQLAKFSVAKDVDSRYVLRGIFSGLLATVRRIHLYDVFPYLPIHVRVELVERGSVREVFVQAWLKHGRMLKQSAQLAATESVHLGDAPSQLRWLWKSWNMGDEELDRAHEVF